MTWPELNRSEVGFLTTSFNLTNILSTNIIVKELGERARKYLVENDNGNDSILLLLLSLLTTATATTLLIRINNAVAAKL